MQLRLKAAALYQCCENFNQYKDHPLHNPTGSAELQWFLIEKEVELGPKPKFPPLARVLVTCKTARQHGEGYLGTTWIPSVGPVEEAQTYIVQ